MTNICVIGIGNNYRGDDGFGPFVIDAISPSLPKGVQTFKESGDIAKIMSYFEDYENVIIVDAVKTDQNPPGTMYCFDALSKNIAKETLHTSTHGFSLNQAVELAKSLGCYPKKCTIVGIEGQDFSQCDSLSEAVAQQVPKVCHTIQQLIKG